MTSFFQFLSKNKKRLVNTRIKKIKTCSELVIIFLYEKRE